jgi:hypothetical protein
MFARGTFHLVALATLLLGTGVGVGEDGPKSGASTGAKPHGLPATGSPFASGAAPTGGEQVGDQIAIDGSAGAPTQRIREGTTLRTKGRFELVGDRVNFYPEEGAASFRILENLALERVVRTVRESSDSRIWTVEAVVTEFQGANFLQLRRATVTIGE